MEATVPLTNLPSLGFFLLGAVSLHDLTNLLILLILIALSGLFSGSEVAIMSLSPTDIELLEEDEDESSKVLLYLRTHTKKLLALLLVCNTICNIGIALLLESILDKFIPNSSYERFSFWLSELLGLTVISPDKLAGFFNFLVAVIGATFIILLFGEITPKIYGQLNNYKFSKLVAIPLRFLGIVMTPFTFLLVAMSSKVERKILERRMGTTSGSKEDLDAAIDLAVSEELESGNQAYMLKGIIKFNDVSTKQVMTSRTDVYGIDLSESFDQVVKIVKENGYSRYPVYVDDIDKMTGILYAKDLIGHLHKSSDFEWQTLVRTNLLYVTESRKIHELLNDFQIKKLHMAIVVDEYGGTSGIVTLEDIMEEIVGEIKDEFDDQHELNFTRIDANNFIFDGKTLINDMCRVIGLDIFQLDEIRGSADSIAGLVLEQTSEMPKKDQELTILQYKFKVLSVTKKRIEKIQITIL